MIGPNFTKGGIKSGRKCIAYIMTGKRHDKEEGGRNVYVTGINLNFKRNIADQMAEVWNTNSKIANQMQHATVSWSQKELDPDNPASAVVAAKILLDWAEKTYPGHQVVIGIQNDGRGHCLHGHVGINNVSMATGEALKGYQYFHQTQKHILNKIDLNYLGYFDYGSKDYEKRQEKKRDRRSRGKYMFTDDLHDRVLSAMDACQSEEELEENLSLRGVRIKRQGQSAEHGEYYSFELDKSVVPDGQKVKERKKALLARSYTLGDDVSPMAFRTMLAQKGLIEDFSEYMADDDFEFDVPTPDELRIKTKEKPVTEMSFEELSKLVEERVFKNSMYDPVYMARRKKEMEEEEERKNKQDAKQKERAKRAAEKSEKQKVEVSEQKKDTVAATAAEDAAESEVIETPPAIAPEEETREVDIFDNTDDDDLFDDWEDIDWDEVGYPDYPEIEDYDEELFQEEATASPIEPEIDFNREAKREIPKTVDRKHITNPKVVEGTRKADFLEEEKRPNNALLRDLANARDWDAEISAEDIDFSL